MNIVHTQWLFVKNVIKLIEYIEVSGFIVTFGEVFRTYDTQLLYLYGKGIEEGDNTIYLVNTKKKEFNKTSKHLKRLAIDLNFFLQNEDGDLDLTYDKQLLEPIGEFWETLHEDNIWGGFWNKNPDTPHFQMSY